jgi:hypothetical protein
MYSSVHWQQESTHMPTPRSRIVDESVTPWYHCISRCVRRARLCGGVFLHRKQWIEDRLNELTGIFSVECAGFAIMDNHLHLLVRLDSRRAEEWSAVDVARRWLCLFPLRNSTGDALAVSEARIRRFADDRNWVDRIRKRLADLGWFMKCLKEPIARRANREDGSTGAFWKGRSYCLHSPCLTNWENTVVLKLRQRTSTCVEALAA